MTLVLNITPDEPEFAPIDFVDRVRAMTDDEFFHFCQENPDNKFERDAQGNIRRGRAAWFLV